MKAKQAWDEAQGFIKRLGYQLVPVRLVEITPKSETKD